MGIATRADGAQYLCEWLNGKWEWYSDYTLAINKPSYMGAIPNNQVLSLSHGALTYDFAAQNGSKNLGGWIDLAAQAVGR